MFIVLQDVGDTMVLDSVRGHRATYDRLASFLASPKVSIELDAAPRCLAFPDSTTLRSFPDPMSRQVAEAWTASPKFVERLFETM